MPYTDVHIEQPRGATPAVLAIKANGGQVLVEKPVGNSWVTANTYSADGAYTLQLGNNLTRFTPSGGAVYEIS